MKSAFEVKQKTFFIIFKGLSVAKNCLRPESAPLTFDENLFLSLQLLSKKISSKIMIPHQIVFVSP